MTTPVIRQRPGIKIEHDDDFDSAGHAIGGDSDVC